MALNNRNNSMKKIVLSIVLNFLLSATAAAQLNPLFPPGSNFDLSAWKLQTLTESLVFTEISASQLQSGYTSSFFYTNSTDGSMVFRVPSNGGTTSPNTSYPRVELRQMYNGANWKLEDTNEYYFTAMCKVDSVAIAKSQIIIGQIHGSQTNSELLKLRWSGYRAKQCYVEARLQKNDTTKSEFGTKLATGLSLGDMISYSIKMKNGLVTVTVNNTSTTWTYTSAYYGTTDSYYFKAGNYLQYDNDTIVVYGQTRFYSLNVNPKTVGVSSKYGLSEVVPESMQLYQNYPNPFNPATSIAYQLVTGGNIALNVYDVLGRKVATLIEGYQQAGRNTTHWNADHLASGIYIIELVQGSKVHRMKGILLR
jgi:hypothetical protein